jgi:trimeric autotransporter adhesin
MGIRKNSFLKRLTRFGAVSALVLSLMPVQFVGAALSSTSVGLSDSRPSQTSQYTITSSGFNTGQTIGCIELDIGTASDGTGSVSGLDTSGSTFVSQSITASGTWTVSNAQSASHKLRLTNSTPVAPQSGSQTAVWGAVVNGSTADTGYFGVITTYTTNSCATPVDTTTVQFIYTNGQSVSLSVDPSIAFTVAGTSSGASCNGATSNATTTATTIPLGTVTTSTNKIGVQNLTVTTNAGNGYTIYTRYTAKPTAGSFTIDDHTGSNGTPTAFSAAGTEAFGYTTNDSSLGTGTPTRFTSSGGNKWAAFTTSNAEIAYSAASVANETTCVGQQSGVSGTTEPGTYTTTVIYTATPVF